MLLLLAATQIARSAVIGLGSILTVVRVTKQKDVNTASGEDSQLFRNNSARSTAFRAPVYPVFWPEEEPS